MSIVPWIVEGGLEIATPSIVFIAAPIKRTGSPTAPFEALYIPMSRRQCKSVGDYSMILIVLDATWIYWHMAIMMTV